MYRFLLRPKWLAFHILVLSAVVGMLALANWQWTKREARNGFVAKVHLREKCAPQDVTILLGHDKSSDIVCALPGKTILLAHDNPSDIEYFRVTATGSYLSTGQLIQINRTQDGVIGVNVITPFQIDGGPLLIVNRGFVADGTVVPSAPTGTLLVGGTARTSEQHKTGELTDDKGGASTEVRRIDLGEIAKRINAQVAPVYIDFIGSKPESATPPVPVPAPDLGGGPPHLSYTVQWCVFSLSVAVGWVFAVKRSARNQYRVATRAQSSGRPDVSATRS